MPTGAFLNFNSVSGAGFALVALFACSVSMHSLAGEFTLAGKVNIAGPAVDEDKECGNVVVFVEPED